MEQISLFAADQHAPEVSDLVGLLAAHGQSTLTARVARISIVVDALWRADLLAEHIGRVGLRPVVSASGSVTVATEPSAALRPMVSAWRTGAAATVPVDWSPTPGQLRVWVLAAGHTVAPGGFALGVDPAVDQHASRCDGLLRGLAEAGIAASYVGPRGGGPLLRVTSSRRLRRLRETIGDRPLAAPTDCWPE